MSFRRVIYDSLLDRSNTSLYVFLNPTIIKQFWVFGLQYENKK